MNHNILTLVIIHQKDSVVLGLKKRGFGMGKWNGFGGKVQGSETLEDAAKRELFEESGLEAHNLQKMGVLHFTWKGKEKDVLEVNVFLAIDFSGQPKETEEMKPEWFLIKDIPYEKMWADDKYWLPLLLEHKKFQGKFIFDQHNAILDYQLHEDSNSF